MEKEPHNYAPYSTYRPDAVALMQAPNGKSMVMDTKIGDPLTSTPWECSARGSYVGMGNITPSFNAKVLGLRERGDPSTHENFDTGVHSRPYQCAWGTCKTCARSSSMGIRLT